MTAPAAAPVVIARLAATAAQEAPDVLGLHGGAVGEVATYGQNGPVRGVRVQRSPVPRLRLYLIVRFGARLDEVAEEVRTRVAATLTDQVPAFAHATVDVHIADVRQSGVDEDRNVTEPPELANATDREETAALSRRGSSARR